MYELIDDFENYSIIQKSDENKKRRKSKQMLNMYFSRDMIIPSSILFDEQAINIIYYCNYKDELKKLKKTLRSPKDIEDQFFLDITRSKLKINNHKVNVYEKIINYLTYQYPKKLHDLLILCTQGVFVNILEWIYQSLPYDFYIGELEIDSNINREMKISIDKNAVLIHKKLRLFGLTKNGNVVNYKLLKCIIHISDYLNSTTIDYEIQLQPYNGRDNN